MIRKSPSGALSPYYYKGGYFHGIHYGDYENDMDSFFDMVEKEEAFILKSPEKKRILMDLYHTNCTADKESISRFVHHIENLSDRIVRLGICTDKRDLHILKRAIGKSKIINTGCIFYNTDMETAKLGLSVMI